MTTRTCKVCGESKDISRFAHTGKGRRFRRRECKDCVNITQNAKRYNTTVGAIQELLENQDHRCAICGTHADEVGHKLLRTASLVIDHNHDTGEVRGLLCPKCNLILGQANDDPQILTNAINYLKEHHATDR
jgi:hypothetical protein